MRVNRVELFHVSVPLPATFHPAWILGYPQTSNNFTLLRVTTSDGRVGHAAGAAFEREREGLGAVLGPYLIGIDAEDITTARARIRELGYLGWRNPWIETAFWDLAAQAQDVPLWRFLGATDRKLPVYASTGEWRKPEEAARLARDLQRQGFRAVKLRIRGRTVEEDVAVVRAAREAVGEGMGIMVDANQGWRVALFAQPPLWDVDRARQFAKSAEPLNLTWLEEPLDMHDFHGYAQLARESRIPIAGGELTSGWDVLKVHLERDGLHVYQPDCNFAGGITEARRVLEACLERGRLFSPHTWTNGLGMLANASVAACALGTPAAAPLEYPIDPPGWMPEARDGLMEKPLKQEAGHVTLPDKPGLGLEIDEEQLAKHGEKFYEGTPSGVVKQVVKAKGLGSFLKIAWAKKRARR